MADARVRVVVRGGGDLGTGAAVRLWRCGVQVVVLETLRPVAVRRTVCLSEAVWDGRTRVEEVEARLVESHERLWSAIDHIPVLVDPTGQSLASLQPDAVVDAIMAKRNTGTRRDMAPRVVGLGPGFTAGEDVHAVVETNRGPHLGRVLWLGTPEPNTGRPTPVAGVVDRVVRAPQAGVLRATVQIGDPVTAGEVVAVVDGVPVRSPIDGLVRGLARSGLQVDSGMKIGDIDPRLDPTLCRLISDKSLAVAGGVVEAVLSGQPR